MTERPYRDRIFKFVAWHELDSYLRAGWTTVRVRALGDYHEQFSVLCEWLCDCAPNETETVPSSPLPPDTPVVVAPESARRAQPPRGLT